MINEKLDKSIFKKQSYKEADNHRSIWMKKTPTERFIAAFRLSLRAYGYDPDDPPKMEKNIFSARKRKG